MRSKALMKLFFILGMMLSISYAQTHLSPISAATAQTFGTFYRGMDAVNWNPANLAYEKKDIQVATKVDTVYRIHVLTTESEEQSDSITNNIKAMTSEDLNKSIKYEDNIDDMRNKLMDSSRNRLPENSNSKSETAFCKIKPPEEDTLSIIDKNSFLLSDHNLGYSKNGTFVDIVFPYVFIFSIFF